MKKFTVILLVAVLAMASIFADVNVDAKISGLVKAKYTINCEEGTFAYTTPNSDVDITFGFTNQSKDVKGEGLRAEVTTKLAWTTTSTLKQFDLGTSTSKSKYLNEIGYFKFTIPSFDIKYNDVWTLSLLSAAEVGDFAVSPIDVLKWYYYGATAAYRGYYYTAKYDDSYSQYTDNGVTFSWNGYTFAAAAERKGKDVKSMYTYAGVETPEFNLGAGFTLQGAGEFNYQGAKDAEKDSWMIGASLKAAYTSDAMTITAATDQAVTIGEEGKKLFPLEDYVASLANLEDDANKVVYDVDAVLTAKFKPATFNVYFAKYATSYYYSSGVKEKNSFKNLLSANVAFNLNCWEAPVKFTVAGLNVLNDAAILNADVQYTFAGKQVVKAFAYDVLATEEYLARMAQSTDAQKKYYLDNGNGQKFGAAAELTFGPIVVDADVFTRIANDTIGFGVGAEYTNDYFVASADVDAEFVYGEKVGENGLLTVSAGLTAANTIVKNATLALSYDSGNILNNDYVGYVDYVTEGTTEHSAGTVVASVTVKF